MAVEKGEAPDAGRRAALAALRGTVIEVDVEDGERTALSRELLRLCRATSEWFAAAGAAINLMAGDRRDCVVAGADDLSRRVAELPFALGEGPAFDAFESHRPVLVPDLSDGEGVAWPGYTSTALELGVRAVFSAPLHVGAIQLGVIEWYDVRPRQLDGDETAMVFEFAALATDMLLLGAPEVPVDGTDLDDRLGTVMDQREQVYQAQGMVMVDLGVDLAEALARMRAHAFARGISLAAVAHDVIEGHRLDGDVK